MPTSQHFVWSHKATLKLHSGSFCQEEEQLVNTQPYSCLYSEWVPRSLYGSLWIKGTLKLHSGEAVLRGKNPFFQFEHGNNNDFIFTKHARTHTHTHTHTTHTHTHTHTTHTHHTRTPHMHTTHTHTHTGCILHQQC